MTPSIGNFLASLVAGAFIALTIGGVLVFISQSDRVTRNS
jgi:Photosystem II reaction centre X protein (PsbX)